MGLARFGKFRYSLKVPKSTMQINKTNHAKLAKKPEWHHSSTLLTKQFYQIKYFPKWLFVSPLSFPWCSHAYKESECICCWTGSNLCGTLNVRLLKIAKMARCRVHNIHLTAGPCNHIICSDLSQTSLLADLWSIWNKTPLEQIQIYFQFIFRASLVRFFVI